MATRRRASEPGEAQRERGSPARSFDPVRAWASAASRGGCTHEAAPTAAPGTDRAGARRRRASRASRQRKGALTPTAEPIEPELAGDGRAAPASQRKGPPHGRDRQPPCAGRWRGSAAGEIGSTRFGPWESAASITGGTKRDRGNRVPKRSRVLPTPPASPALRR